VLNVQPIYAYIAIHDVQSTLSMQSMFLLEGSGTCPPGNFEKKEARRWNLVAFQPLDKV